MFQLSLFVFVWLLCAVLTYGLQLAFWQRKFPTIAAESYKRDVISSAVSSLLLGWSGLIGWCLFTTFNRHSPWKYGFRLL